MRVELAAAPNIKLENVLYTWGNAQSLWVPLSYQQVIILANSQPTVGKKFSQKVVNDSRGLNLNNESIFPQYYKHQLLNNLLLLDSVSGTKLPALRKGKCQFILLKSG